MDRRTTRKRIWSLLLTLTMVLTMSVTALPVSAAGSGTISLTYNPNVTGLEKTNFKLYKAAEFGRYTDGKNKGKVRIDLTEPFAGSGVDLNGIGVPEDPSDTSSDDYKRWQATWLGKASQLANEVKTTGSSAKPVWWGTVNKSSTAQAIGGEKPLSNGIYLLVGEQTRVGDKYWWPVPVLIMVLNGESTFDLSADVKMTSKPVVYKHKVTKAWAEDTEDTRADIRVGIYYGEDGRRVDAVSLPYEKGKTQTYTWYSTEEVNAEGKRVIKYSSEDLAGDVDPDKIISFTEDKSKSWTVKEMRETTGEKDALKYYTSVVTNGAETDQAEPAGGDTDVPDEDTPDSTKESFIITNTFTKAELTINKDLASYLNQETGNAVVVFDVTATVNGKKAADSEETEEKVIYHNQVSIPFAGPGKKSITINNLPVNFDKLTVKEIYSTHYNNTIPEGGTVEITTQSSNNKYTADFENEFNNRVPETHASGISNNYTKDGKTFKINNRDDGKDSPR